MASSGNTWQKKLIAKSKTQWQRRVLGTETPVMNLIAKSKRGHEVKPQDNKPTRPGLAEVGKLPTMVTFKPTRSELEALVVQYKGTITVGKPGKHVPAMGKGRAAFNVGGCGDGHARQYLAVAVSAGSR